MILPMLKQVDLARNSVVCTLHYIIVPMLKQVELAKNSVVCTLHIYVHCIYLLALDDIPDCGPDLVAVISHCLHLDVQRNLRKQALLRSKLCQKVIR